MSKSFFLAKAASKLRIAEYALQQHEYEITASLLYYALFHTMQNVVGAPPQVAWKHVAIAKVFNTICFRQQIFPQEKLRDIVRMYDNLYTLRKQSDYSDVPFSDEDRQKMQEYCILTNEILSCLQQV